MLVIKIPVDFPFIHFFCFPGIPIDTDPEVLEAQLKHVAPNQLDVTSSPEFKVSVEDSQLKSVKNANEYPVTPSSAQQTPYLVVSPNGSCTLSTEHKNGGKPVPSSGEKMALAALQQLASTTSDDPLQSTTETLKTSHPEMNETNSDMLLMVSCGDGTFI